MGRRKRYSQAGQEKVISLYRKSGKMLREFCEREGLEISRVESMAHARRKFHDALKVALEDRDVASVIAIMAKL